MKTIAEYFKSALASQTMKTIDFKDCNWTVSYQEIQNGKINDNIADELFAGINKKQKKSENVLLVLKTIRTIYHDAIETENNIKELTGILFLPCSILANGILIFSDDGNIPWIPRDFLAPMTEPQLSLGTMDKYDQFLENSVDIKNQIQDWNSYYNYAKKLFEAVCGARYEDNVVGIGSDKIETEDKCYLILDGTVNSSFHILKLYNAILKDLPDIKLFKQFTKKAIEPSIELIPNHNFNKMREHCGQMGGEYPLSESQRESLNHFNALNQGEILAVNGPPGTGKTTLLQSIVADLYVKHALNKEKAPLIFASSTNNQAVTNIIDSFGKINPAGIKNLENRWINNVHSFAVYFPSNNKAKEAQDKNYHYTSILGDNFAADVDKAENITASEEKLIEECTQYFNKNFETSKQCEEALYDELILLKKGKDRCVEIFKKLADSIGDICYKDYMLLLTDKINDTKIKMNNYDEEINSLLNKINYIRDRVEFWKNENKNISPFIRILSFIPYFKTKVLSHIAMKKIPAEAATMSNLMSINDIIEYYSKQITDLNKKIYYIEQEKLNYVNLLQQYNNNKNNLNSIKKQLLDSLKEIEKHNVNIIDKHEQYIHDFDYIKINETFDSGLRYIMFWLAVHYYESRWVQKEDLISDKQRGRNFINVIDKLYHRLAMITPCMVTTFFMLPKQFLVYDGNERKLLYLYNFIDLLIVDEAGQVSPEIAAASFSLAKKAIIVGDEHQIPPVWGVERALDIALAKQNDVIVDKEEFETLSKIGLTCSNSSVMKVASNSCKYEKYGKGMFLKEHRRCYNEIIEYCNQLVYKGHLQPLRGLGKNDKTYPVKILPHMGYYDIPVPNSARKGSSRLNKTEADKISQWIDKNFDFIKHAYGNSVKENELLGIVTPFSVQARILKNSLKTLAPDIAKKITIGTVHTFQGAERRIIIMSTVYGFDDGCYFIDRNKSLMNVAVSRAKDSFLIFGSRNCLKNSTSQASGLLKKFTDTSITD